MAEKYVVMKKRTLDNIGNSIRRKTGGSELIPPQEMPSAIDSIESDNTEALTEQLKASMTENFGYDYADRDFNQLVGTAPEVEEIVETQPYANGELYTLRSKISGLAYELDDDMFAGGVNTVRRSAEIIEAKMLEIKQNACDVLNLMIDPSDRFTVGNSWADILVALRQLPADIEDKIAQIPRRTEEDIENAEIVKSWDDAWASAINTNITTISTAVPYMNTLSISNFTNLFRGCKCRTLNLNLNNAESLYQTFNSAFLESIKIKGSTHYVTNWQGAFYQAGKLKEVIGDLDFSSATNTTNVFYGATVLENVTFVPNSIKMNIALPSSEALTQSSVLSLINGLDASSPSTLQLRNHIKVLMDNWTCEFNAETGLFESSTSASSISFTTAVTDGKGWTLE